ncbi:MAG: hypothetical protein ACUVQ4_00545 [bacterium]
MILIFIISQYAYGFSENDSLIDSLKMRQEIMPVSKKISDQWFSQDKFLHFSACASIVGLSYHTLVCRLKKTEDTGKLYAVSLTAVIGLGKEFYDKKKKKHFSWKDLCWDGLGLAFGYFAFIHDY